MPLHRRRLVDKSSSKDTFPNKRLKSLSHHDDEVEGLPHAYVYQEETLGLLPIVDVVEAPTPKDDDVESPLQVHRLKKRL